ncbi:hypothetical protein Glove_360g118 [Diversispora epigaea]|uniref:Uncharacterized protein n=1 Tax=Diversispora epigaea TaxID=1348612 RepID=A0A397HA04_9GLOM|nr:hypothetical protein Glove_360g118 [Diversispora epigaea]
MNIDDNYNLNHPKERGTIVTRTWLKEGIYKNKIFSRDNLEHYLTHGAAGRLILLGGFPSKHYRYLSTVYINMEMFLVFQAAFTS